MRELTLLLEQMRPVLDAEHWAFCQLSHDRDLGSLSPLATFREREGLTVVLAAGAARAAGLTSSFDARCITLTVPSELEAVGFMARVSAALARHGIPCNVMAATSHDHLFVPAERADQALRVLEQLSRTPGQRYRQVDVFTGRAYAGNGLAVFPDAGGLTSGQMLAITGELKQFESIFLERTGTPGKVRARIFTVDEELPFAGHPLLGAAGVLHLEAAGVGSEAEWRLDLHGREVRIRTTTTEGAVAAEMDQGLATFGPPLSARDAGPFLEGLGLPADAAHPTLPLQRVSTGLPYLIVPLPRDLGRARIRHDDFPELLATVGAKFVYVLDPERREGRTWDNRGLVEDVATGSAAGPTGAYLVRHGAAHPGELIRISQGARGGRPSELRVMVRTEQAELAVTVAGDVVPIGEGLLTRLPPA